MQRYWVRGTAYRALIRERPSAMFQHMHLSGLGPNQGTLFSIAFGSDGYSSTKSMLLGGHLTDWLSQTFGNKTQTQRAGSSTRRVFFLERNLKKTTQNNYQLLSHNELFNPFLHATMPAHRIEQGFAAHDRAPGTTASFAENHSETLRREQLGYGSARYILSDHTQPSHSGSQCMASAWRGPACVAHNQKTGPWSPASPMGGGFRYDVLHARVL